MKIDKRQIDPILGQWIKWDGDLATHLRDIQLKLLYDRIVQGMTYNELSVSYKSTPKLIKEIFHAVLLRIENHCHKLTTLILTQLNNQLEAFETGKREPISHVFEFETIYLN